MCSVFTPYYSEEVMFDIKKRDGKKKYDKPKKDSDIKELDVKNEDGITILEYLKTIYPGKVLVPSNFITIVISREYQLFKKSGFK